MSRFKTNHVTLILALLGILLCTFEPKKKKNNIGDILHGI